MAKFFFFFSKCGEKNVDELERCIPRAREKGANGSNNNNNGSKNENENNDGDDNIAVESVIRVGHG